MKPQIEKVEHHNLTGLESFFILSHYPSGKMLQSNYHTESIARMKAGYEVGMWRIKELKNKLHE